MKFLFFILFAPFTTWALCSQPQPAIEVARVNRQDLTENSGIDFSRQHQDVFWAINDSGNSAEIFAQGLNGQNYGKFQIKDAGNFDWEDLAVAECLHQKGRDCIYIPDIGDNFRLRESFTVYVVEEPADYKKSGILPIAETVEFKVKQKSNFEAFAVNEVTREFYFISKNDKMNFPNNVAHVFALKEGEKLASPVATLDFNQLTLPLKKGDKVITAADFDSASQTLLLGTYDNAFEIGLADLPFFKDKVRKIKVPKLDQGESIAYYQRQGKVHLVATSEGRDQPLYVVPCFASKQTQDYSEYLKNYTFEP